MRSLFLPQISTGEVAAESDVYSHRTIMWALRELGPVHGYVWLRRGDSDDGIGEADVTCFFEDPRSIRSFYQQMALADLYRLHELFSWQSGQFPIDAVWTSRSAVAPLLTLGLGDQTGNFHMPVVITEPRVYGPGEKGHNAFSETQVAVRAAGYATCYGMYWSKWEKDAALSAAEQYLQAGLLKRWDEKAFVVDALATVPQEAVGLVRSPDQKRLIFAGRLNSNKKYLEVIEAYAKVLMGRTDVEAWVHAGTGAFSKLNPGREHRWHVTSERLPRNEYWQMLGTSHVGAYLSGDEGANVTVQEMILAGIALALPNRPWVYKLFYPHTYPFLVDGPSKLPALLDWMLDHYDEAYARLTPIRQFIEQERSWPAFTRKFGYLREALERHPRPEAYRTFRTIALETMGADGGVPFSTMRQLLRGWFKTAPQYGTMRGMYACYQAVRDLDNYGGADPYLLRPEEHADDRDGDAAPQLEPAPARDPVAVGS